MEAQVNSYHPYFRRWLIMILMVMLACNFLSSPEASTPVPQDPTGETTQEIPAPLDPTEEVSQNVPEGPDPLDRLLEMRSVQFNLTALQPAGDARSLQGEIDSAGNMHLRFSSPIPVLPDLPEKLNPDLKLPEEIELYVVDGKAYQPDDQNPAWATAPLADDYGKELSNLLHGPNGPGLWLSLLPAGSLTSAGQESVGGFAADKYTVNGSVNDQTITGNLWYESHALVQVELHIPAALLEPDKPGAQGELKITLEVQKADVELVTLPTPPIGEATSQP